MEVEFVDTLHFKLAKSVPIIVSYGIFISVRITITAQVYCTYICLELRRIYCVYIRLDFVEEM